MASNQKGGYEIGVVENIEYTSGGIGNQWTTISGVRYCTFWDVRTIDWKRGDTVVFLDFTRPVFSNTPSVRQATEIHKVPAGAMTFEQFRATAVATPNAASSKSLEYLGGECSIEVADLSYRLQLHNALFDSTDLCALEQKLYAWALANVPSKMIV